MTAVRPEASPGKGANAEPEAIPSSTAPGAERFPALDGLRGLAAACIVIYHLGFATLARRLDQAGHDVWGRLLDGLMSSGVELFFVLSGVVLLRPYFRTERRLQWAVYLKRRGSRLWPPFLAAWALAGLTVLLLTAFPTWWDSELPRFDAATWLAQAGVLYWGDALYNFAWWSLSVEVMFYAVAPLLVAVLVGRRRGIFLGVLVAAAAVAQFAHLYIDQDPYVVHQFLAYVSCFAAGVLLAAQDLSRRRVSWCMAVGAALVLWSALDARVNAHVGYGLVYLGVTALALERQSCLARRLSSWPMVWLGERSYSLFLTHFSVISLSCWAASWWADRQNLYFYGISRALALTGSVAVACLVFELVERRFARGLMTAGHWAPLRRSGTTPWLEPRRASPSTSA